MKIEYVTSSLGIGTELHISAAEYKRVNSEAGFGDHSNMLFAVKAYAIANESSKIYRSRDLEEAYRHIKKTGTIVLATKTDGTVNWCELYVITEGKIIPVITSNDGRDFSINYSSKTTREMNRIRKEE